MFDTKPKKLVGMIGLHGYCCQILTDNHTICEYILEKMAIFGTYVALFGQEAFKCLLIFRRQHYIRGFTQVTSLAPTAELWEIHINYKDFFGLYELNLPSRTSPASEAA